MELTMLSLIVATLGFLAYYIFRWMSFFERKGILHEKPIPILGNMAPVLFRRKHLAKHMQRLYNKYSDRKYFGVFDFTTPVVVIRDPQLITAIGVKHFDHFMDHKSVVDERLDPLMGRNLFSLHGDHWREVRKLLSPAFTSSKMKMMYSLICDCAENFIQHVHDDCKAGREMNLKEIFGRYTNDVVATCAFGISVDSMRDPKNDFYVLGRKTLTFDAILSLKFMLSRNFPYLMQFFNIRMFGTDVTNFFTSIVKSTVNVRDEKGIYRPDMIQLMMEARGDGKGHELSIDEMTAQAFVFFFAGFDATASFLSILAHEIGVNPDVQEKLRDEINDVMAEHNGRPTYEAINQMKYLDAVVTETLRFYPVAVFLDRLCVKDFELPPAAPGADPVVVKKGESVWFTPYSIQHDSQYYPDPEKFDPERFMGQQPADASLYLPFGIGPRMCIGNRFALMESKVLIVYLLANCSLEPTARTERVMDFDPGNLQMVPRGGFWLKFKSLEHSWISSHKSEEATNGKARTN